MTDIHEAAARLQRRLSTKFPIGTINTLVYSGSKGSFLRVLVEPSYHRTTGIPATFQGFKVMVERRPLVSLEDGIRAISRSTAAQSPANSWTVGADSGMEKASREGASNTAPGSDQNTCNGGA